MVFSPESAKIFRSQCTFVVGGVLSTVVSLGFVVHLSTFLFKNDVKLGLRGRGRRTRSLGSSSAT